METKELKNEVDRKHAERSERRKRTRTYKDRPVQRKESVPKYEGDS